jgi:hypothetical protein
VVGIVTRLQVEKSAFRIPHEEMFLFPEMSRPALGPTQPSMQWVRGCFPGNKAAWA